MKIIEALKELPTLDKRISKNIALINEYSSDVDINEDWEKQSLAFGTPEKQREEINSLIQSTNDLVERRARLRRALTITNAEVEVSIRGETRTIAEWIDMRRGGMNLRIKAVEALNDNNGNMRLNNVKFDAEKGIRIIRFFDVAERNNRITELQAIRDEIDAKLEMVNATTELSLEVA